jgi:hypothetical protein
VWKYEVNQIKSTERLDAGACRVSFTGCTITLSS